MLAAGTLAQVAVIRLRVREPGLERPVRVPWDLRLRGAAVPVPAVVGAVLTAALWVLLLATHEGARILGPLWLLAGAGIFLGVRRAQRGPLLGSVEEARPALVGEPEPAYRRILVPMKGGDLGEECLATAIRVAAGGGATVEVVTVVALPMERALDAPCPDEDRRAAEVLEGARDLAAEQGVQIAGAGRARPRDRRGDRGRGEGPRRRPDRGRLVVAMAPPGPLLQPHGRPRPAPRPLRGDGRRLPRGGPGGERGGGELGCVRDPETGR